MESKNKLFGYVSSLSEFNKLKVSADIDNKTYTIGGGNIQQCAEGEVPDVRWHIVVFIEDVTRIWTHGKFYASANAKLSDNYASPVYVEVKDVETGEILFDPAKPGETIEEAILQLDTNISTLLAEILKNEEVVSTALNEHNLASGFNTHGKYVVNESAKYISTATSLSEADTLLDTAIANIASNIEILSGDLSDLFIPTKTSDLTNDSGFLTSATLPKNVSHFNNDAGYITSAAIPKSLSSFTNDMDYITSDDIPTKVSEFTNDAKYQTESDVKAAIDALIDNAPGTLDTLGEIAEVLKDNQDGIGALVTEIAKKANTSDVNTALDKKADKETVNDLSDTVDDVKDAIDTIAGTTNNIYTANASAKYINNATSLVDADNKLDSAIAGVASELSNLSKEVEDIVIPTNVSAFTNDAKYAYQGDIPTKVSQLENDSKYLTTYYTPTKLSEFTNDTNYALKSEIPTKVAQLTDASNYALASNIPTNVSQLINDSNYATVSQVPTSTSQLTNDSGFITIDEVPEVSVPKNLSEYNNDAGFITIGDVPEVSKNLAEYDNSQSKFVSESELTGKNYITMSDVEGKNYITLDEVPEVSKDLSQYDNSTSKFVSESELTGKNYATKDELPTVPTNVSAFTNDANYATTTYVGTELEKKANNTLTQDSKVYPEVTNLETQEMLFTNIVAGDTLEAAILKTDANTATLVEEVLKNEKVISATLNAHNSASGFNENANYIQQTSANYINSATSLAEADNLLDSAIKAVETTVDNIHIPTTVAELTDASNYAKKTELPTVPTNVSAFTNDANYITSAAIPTKLSAFENDCTYMTEAQVEAKVASLVDSAPEALNTLNELAAALGDDPNFATTISTEIGKKADSTYVASELEKKANDKLSQDSVVYPNIIYNDAELFTNTYANVSLEQAILNVDKNTKTLAEEVIKNEEVISAALNAHNVSAGFTINGKYEQQTDANYIDSATSLSEADLLLDAAIKDVADIVSVISGNVDGIDIPKNVTDLADHANYVTKTELNSLSYVTSSALEALNYVDSTYVTSELEKKADLTYVTSELEKKANNTLTKDSKDYPTVKNFETGEILFTKVTSGDTLEDAIIKTDSNTATLVEEVLKNELVISTALNKINSSAGFNENADYVKNESANYIQSANSLKDADNLLDAAIKTVANSVDQKIGNIDFSTYVTKQQLVDAAYITTKDAVSKQQLVDASYVTSTTLAGLDYADKAYVSSYVGQEIAKLVDTAPQTLDTLNELAAALGDDPNFATTVMTEIGKKADSTYVAEELEKKANAVVTGEFDEYPVLKNTHTGEELFVNCHDGIEISNAIHNIDKNTYTLVGEILKNEEVISNAFNKINTAAGFDENANFIANENANVIWEATNLTEAVNILDTVVGELADDVYSINVGLSDEYQSATYPEDLTNVEFIAPIAGDDLDTAIGKLDVNVANLVNETLKIEETVSAALNRLNKSAGFDINGIYHPAEDANFISEATSVKEAIDLLDANMGNSSIEHDGAYFPIVRDITTEEEKYLFSYLYAGDSVTDAIYKTDSNVATLAYEVIRNEYVVSAFAYQINNSIGLNEYAEYKPKTSANYISDAKSLVDADNKLDAAIKSTNDTISSLSNTISNIHIPTTVAELNDSDEYYKKSELTRVSQLYNDSEYQRKGEVENIVSTYIANVVNSAPETLDTLNELATALGNDENFATNVTNQIASKANNTISYDGALYPAVIDINAEEENVQIFVNTYSGTTLEQYVRNVDDNVARLVQENLDTEYVVSTAINKLNMSAGFSEQAEYVQNASANYIQGAASLADADNMLDTAIKAVADSISTHGGYLYLEDFDKTNLQNALTLALSSLEEGEDAIIDCTYFKGEHTITGDGFIINNPVKLIFGGVDIIHDNTNGTNLFTFNTNNISIVGLNRNTDKSKIDNGATIFRMTNPDTTLNGYHIKSRGNKNLEIKDITFVGLRTTHGRQYNNASYPLDGVGGIYIEKAKPEVTEPHNTCNNIRIENILIAGSKGHGIYIDTPILSTFKNIRLSDCGGHGIFVNAGTSLLLENIYCSSANFAGFCIYGATYVSLNNCVSESSGIGFWIRSSFNVTLTSPGVEATRTFGGSPWRLSQPISGKHGLGLTTLASDNSTVIDIVDVTETASGYFIGYGILITGGRSINIFTPYIKTIAEPIITESYPDGTSRSKNVKYINVLDNNRETYILNPSFKELSDSETPGHIKHEIGIAAEVEHLELVYSTDETILTGELDSTTYVTDSDLRAPIYCKSDSSIIRSGKTIVTNYSTPNAPTTTYEFTNKEYVDAAIKVVADSVSNYATTTYVASELEKKANNTISNDSVVYPDNLVNFATSEPLFVNTTAGTTLEQAFLNVDKNVKTLVEEVVKDEEVISTALNNINISAGLDEHANYIVNDTANYISGATSLAEADNILDNAIKAVADKIPTVPTKVSAFTNDANYITTSALKMSEGYTPVVYEEVADVNNEGTYIYGQNSSVKAGETFENAINKIDQNVSTLLTETLKNEHVTALAIATMNESCGFGTDMVYDENTNATVISEAKSLQHADRLLDGAIGFYVGVSKPVNTIDDLVSTGSFIIPTDKHVCIFNLLPGTQFTDIAIPEISMNIDGNLDAGKEISVYIHTNTTTEITQLNLCGLSNGPLTNIPKNSTVKVSITSDGTNIYSCGNK